MRTTTSAAAAAAATTTTRRRPWQGDTSHPAKTKAKTKAALAPTINNNRGAAGAGGGGGAGRWQGDPHFVPQAQQPQRDPASLLVQELKAKGYDPTTGGEWMKRDSFSVNNNNNNNHRENNDDRYKTLVPTYEPRYEPQPDAQGGAAAAAAAAAAPYHHGYHPKTSANFMRHDYYLSAASEELETRDMDEYYEPPPPPPRAVAAKPPQRTPQRTPPPTTKRTKKWVGTHKKPLVPVVAPPSPLTMSYSVEEEEEEHEHRRYQTQDDEDESYTYCPAKRGEDGVYDDDDDEDEENSQWRENQTSFTLDPSEFTFENDRQRTDDDAMITKKRAIMLAAAKKQQVIHHPKKNHKTMNKKQPQQQQQQEHRKHHHHHHHHRQKYRAPRAPVAPSIVSSSDAGGESRHDDDDDDDDDESSTFFSGITTQTSSVQPAPAARNNINNNNNIPKNSARFEELQRKKKKIREMMQQKERQHQQYVQKKAAAEAAAAAAVELRGKGKQQQQRRRRQAPATPHRSPTCNMAMASIEEGEGDNDDDDGIPIPPPRARREGKNLPLLSHLDPVDRHQHQHQHQHLSSSKHQQQQQQQPHQSLSPTMRTSNSRSLVLQPPKRRSVEAFESTPQQQAVVVDPPRSSSTISDVLEDAQDSIVTEKSAFSPVMPPPRHVIKSLVDDTVCTSTEEDEEESSSSTSVLSRSNRGSSKGKGKGLWSRMNKKNNSTQSKSPSSGAPPQSSSKKKKTNKKEQPIELVTREELFQDFKSSGLDSRPKRWIHTDQTGSLTGKMIVSPRQQELEKVIETEPLTIHSSEESSWRDASSNNSGERLKKKGFFQRFSYKTPPRQRAAPSYDDDDLESYQQGQLPPHQEAERMISAPSRNSSTDSKMLQMIDLENLKSGKAGTRIEGSLAAPPSIQASRGSSAPSATGSLGLGSDHSEEEEEVEEEEMGVEAVLDPGQSLNPAMRKAPLKVDTHMVDSVEGSVLMVQHQHYYDKNNEPSRVLSPTKKLLAGLSSPKKAVSDMFKKVSSPRKATDKMLQTVRRSLSPIRKSKSLIMAADPLDAPERSATPGRRMIKLRANERSQFPTLRFKESERNTSRDSPSSWDTSGDSPVIGPPSRTSPAPALHNHSGSVQDTTKAISKNNGDAIVVETVDSRSSASSSNASPSPGPVQMKTPSPPPVRMKTTASPVPSVESKKELELRRDHSVGGSRTSKSSGGSKDSKSTKSSRGSKESEVKKEGGGTKSISKAPEEAEEENDDILEAFLQPSASGAGSQSMARMSPATTPLSLASAKPKTPTTLNQAIGEKPINSCSTLGFMAQKDNLKSRKAVTFSENLAFVHEFAADSMGSEETDDSNVLSGFTPILDHEDYESDDSYSSYSSASSVSEPVEKKKRGFFSFLFRRKKKAEREQSLPTQKSEESSEYSGSSSFSDEEDQEVQQVTRASPTSKQATPQRSRGRKSPSPPPNSNDNIEMVTHRTTGGQNATVLISAKSESSSRKKNIQQSRGAGRNRARPLQIKKGKSPLGFLFGSGKDHHRNSKHVLKARPGYRKEKILPKRKNTSPSSMDPEDSRPTAAANKRSTPRGSNDTLKSPAARRKKEPLAPNSDSLIMDTEDLLSTSLDTDAAEPGSTAMSAQESVGSSLRMMEEETETAVDTATFVTEDDTNAGTTTIAPVGDFLSWMFPAFFGPIPAAEQNTSTPAPKATTTTTTRMPIHGDDLSSQSSNDIADHGGDMIIGDDEWQDILSATETLALQYREAQKMDDDSAKSISEDTINDVNNAIARFKHHAKRLGLHEKQLMEAVRDDDRSLHVSRSKSLVADEERGHGRGDLVSDKFVQMFEYYFAPNGPGSSMMSSIN